MNESLQISRSSSLNALAICILFTVLGFGLAIYAQVGNFDFVELDDPPLVVENPYVNKGLTPDAVWWAFTFRESENLRTAEGVKNVWAPLAFLSHALDVQLWGMNPGAHHLTSMCLHLVTTSLVFWLFQQLTGRAFVAVMVAAVFCLHPLRVESVAWISERKDVLSGLFSVSCLALYVRWATRLSTTGARDVNRRKRLFSVVLILFVASCLAKPTSVHLPVLMILMDVWPLGRAQTRIGSGWQSIRLSLDAQIREKWPMLLVVIVISILSIYFQYGGSHARSMGSLGLGPRLLEMPALVFYYLERTFLPVDLFPSYPRYPHAIIAYSLCALAALGGITAFAWNLRRRRPAILFGWVWFLVVLSPVLGLLYVGPSFSSDRYTYLAHCGLALGIAESAAYLGERNARLRILTFVFGAAAAGAMAWLSWIQVSIWKSTGALYQHGVEAQPFSSVAWNNLGAHLLNEGNAQEALACFRKALEVGDGHDVHYNLGLAARDSGAPAETQIQSFRASLALAPDYVPALTELGLALIDPNSGKAYNSKEGRMHLERVCDIMEYVPSNKVAYILNRLLESARHDGDREQHLRILSRAERAGMAIRPLETSVPNPSDLK